MAAGVTSDHGDEPPARDRGRRVRPSGSTTSPGPCIEDGELERLITEDGITGVTSNPTIFEKAIAGSDRYDEALEEAARKRPRRARHVLRARLPRHPRRRRHPARRLRRDGGPGRLRLLRAAARARRRRRRLRRAGEGHPRAHRPPERPHQGPGHRGGRPGVRGADRRRRVGQRHAAVRRRAATRRSPRPTSRGLERRLEAGEPIDRIASVASFFVSRVDGKVDKKLEELGREDLAGQGRRRQRARRLRVLPADLLRRALGEAGGRGRERAAAAVGVHLDEEPGLPGHAVRRRADRPGHRQHDARRDDRGRARPRDGRAHGRQGRRRARTRCSTSCARPASTFDDIVGVELVEEGVASFAKTSTR